MGITRVTLTDDDGSGLTGTVINNSKLQEIYDGLEAAFTWTAVAHDAGNYTASESMTWTVASGDQIVFAYWKFGTTMMIAFAIETSTVGGTPSTDLRITIPGSFTANRQCNGACMISDNGTNAAGVLQVDSGTTYIRVLKADLSNWTASTDNTAVRGQLIIETTA